MFNNDAKPDYLAMLFQQRSQSRIIHFDEQAVPAAGLSDLNSTLWNRFRTVLSPKDDREFLEKMKLIVKNKDEEEDEDEDKGKDEGEGEGEDKGKGDDKGKDEGKRDGKGFSPTVSGVLLASDAPERFIKNAYIQAVCYRGTARNGLSQNGLSQNGLYQNGLYQIDAKDITGPLDVQIKDACKFVEQNMRVYAIKAPNRIETPQYSINAVFEAVVNAVAHRDYAVYGSKIRLHLFSDRLEIYSPGALPNTMTVDSLSERQSTRNELITYLLARCPMNVNAVGSHRDFIMDKRGEGVPIIITESEKLSGKRPDYYLLDDAELKLTIYAAKPPA